MSPRGWGGGEERKRVTERGMTSEGSSALLCGGIVSWRCLLSSMGQRGCVKVGWNGYSSYFMCFGYWKQNRAKDSVSEPLYRMAPDTGVAAVWRHRVWHLRGPRQLWAQVETTRLPARLLAQPQPRAAAPNHLAALGELSSEPGAPVGMYVMLPYRP